LSAIEDKTVRQTGFRLGLALSGGGVRAAVFHLGVLRRLASAGHLERVTHLSTVSGGSLIVGALFSHSQMIWPTSEMYLTDVYPALRNLLTSRDLFSFRALGLWGLLTQNWKLVFRRCEILVWLLGRQWNVEASLSELPESPVWHINTTCLETGKNWRFSKGEMGDWMFGRHYSPRYKIAEAIAASAAIPYAIGALRLKLPLDGWWRTDPATRTPLEKKVPQTRIVNLWDGGAYENLGLEALYKPDEGLKDCDLLICSDASGPLAAPKRFQFLHLLKGALASPRLFDIAGDQIRSLRTRMFMNSIRKGDVDGFFVRLGQTPRELNQKRTAQLELKHFLTDQQCGFCLRYPTGLSRMTEEDFDLLARHGFEVADGVLANSKERRFGDPMFWR
jgi:NTE family protein